MSVNLTPFSSDGGFITAGNITTAVSASPAPTISGFSTVSADNFRLISGNITGGIATVVDDSINSIELAPGAQMDVFGFPFSGGGVRGQLTISGVTTPNEVNGNWYYQSLNTYIYQIYTDSTYSTLVDATGWSAYTGGGTVAITKQNPAANIVINSNGYFSKFDNTGDLTLPGDLLLANNASITTTNATGNVDGKSINIRAGAADQGDYYATAGGNLNLIGGLGAGNDGGGGGPGGAVNITSGASADVAGHAGNVTINTGGANTWTFDYTGMLTVPGEGVINSVDDTVTLRSFNTSTGNANSVYLGSSGGLGFNDQAAGGNWLEIFRNGTEPEIRVPVGRGNLNIQTAEGANVYNWTFDNTGNIQGNISLTGANITINNAPGGAEGAELKWALPAVANTSLSGTVVQDVYASGMRFFESGGNSRGLTMDLGNAPNGTATAVGYRDIPQITLGANVTANATNAGRHFYSTTAGNLQITLPDNANVAFPTGATLTVVVNAAGNVIVAQGTGVSLYMAGSSSTGNRTVGAYGLASVMKVATDTWVISGTGVY